jgi:hypothetical protein
LAFSGEPPFGFGLLLLVVCFFLVSWFSDFGLPPLVAEILLLLLLSAAARVDVEPLSLCAPPGDFFRFLPPAVRLSEYVGKGRRIRVAKEIDTIEMNYRQWWRLGSFVALGCPALPVLLCPVPSITMFRILVPVDAVRPPNLVKGRDTLGKKMLQRSSGKICWPE